MMPKIDFYILSENASQLPLACQLVEKAYQQNHKIYIQTENLVLAEELDQLLWTYRDNSFLPHSLVQKKLEPRPPIQIGFGPISEDHSDILINLSHDVPNFYHKFSRILEVVSSHPDHQTRARERFRFYRTEACEINTHKL